MKKILNFIWKYPKKVLNLQRIEKSCRHQEWIFDERKEVFQCKNCEITKPTINF